MPMMPPQSSTRASGGPHPDQPSDVARRLEDVHRRIAGAAERAGRSPHAVTLVAISKSFPPELVRAARQAGQADFGEARAQELARKVEALGPGVRWHFVGRLQRNKVADVVGVASLIHSMDRLKLAEEIAGRAQRGGRVQRVLLQVNTADDPSKAGVASGEALAMVAKVRELPGIACEGLMTMPALDADPRPAFAQLRALRDAARERFPEVQHLSMGMTGDLEVAVEEGATIVRVGEGVFGPRRTDSS
jgi:pyridoxal phosphate enzyme (YggS family)